MLCKRIIASIVLKNGVVVKGRNYAKDRVVGTITQTVRLFNERWIDEICVFNTNEFNPRIIKVISENNFVPLTYVGGIDSTEKAVEAIQNGADKVGITWRGDTQIYENISKVIGTQSVVCVTEGIYPAVSCGEYILQSKSNDGCMAGMDTIPGHKTIPTIVSSGCSSCEDAYNVLQTHDGIAIGALFSFTECTPKTIKRYLKDKGVVVRWVEAIDRND